MLYLTVRKISSSDRRLLPNRRSALSLKTVRRTVLTFARSDFALLARHGRLQVPPHALFGCERRMLYLTVRRISSSDRRLLPNRRSALSLKTGRRTVLTFVRSDFALLARLGRLQVPPHALFECERRMLYLTVRKISSSDRRLLPNSRSALSLKTVRRTVLTFARSDFALLARHARLQVPPHALFG